MLGAERLSSMMPGFTLLRVVIVTSLFIIAYSGFRIADNAARSYQLGLQMRQLQQDVARDQAEYAQLDALRRYMRSDAFIEAQAREEGLVMPGDVPVAVSAPGPVSASDQNIPNGAWWEKYYSP